MTLGKPQKGYVKLFVDLSYMYNRLQTTLCTSPSTHKYGHLFGFVYVHV